MPAQKLKSKIRIGSGEIKTYGEPRTPFQRLMERAELPHELKDALAAQSALCNPTELQHNVNKAVLCPCQRLA
jgi:hypothetical protein